LVLLTWPFGAALVSLFALVPTWQFGAALALSLALAMLLAMLFVPCGMALSALFPMDVGVWELGACKANYQ
jgi:hypothetical protein